jgi:hypothetical protein
MMMRLCFFKLMTRAVALSIIILAAGLGFTQPVVQAQQSETTPEATEIDRLPTYQVHFVESDDPLNVRSGPGVQYPVVKTLGNEAEVQATGDAKLVGDDLWLPIQTFYDPSVTGWINRQYVVREVDPTVFCADEAVKALVEKVRLAVRDQDGDALAQTILPARGLYMGGLYWGDNLRLSPDEVMNLFGDSTIREWGHNMNSGDVIEGSLADFIAPMLENDLLPENVSIACYDNQDGLMGYGTYRAGTGLESIPFYSVMRPGEPGYDLNWGAWALGIDDWEGTPVLVYLSHYVWVP